MTTCTEIAVHLAFAYDVFDGVFLCCPFSPRDVLDEIWDLIESVSEGFPTYSERNTGKTLRDPASIFGF